MNLHQIKIEFIPEHDRLLLRISTSDGKEVLMWLTRRCVKLLWPGLVKLAHNSPDVAAQSHPDARQAVLGMRHEAALGKSDFSRPYDEAARDRPFGAEPVLVARMQSRALDNGQFVLSLLPREGQGINLTLDETLLHSICKLIQAAVEKSEWDLKLVLPVGNAAVEPGSRTLN